MFIWIQNACTGHQPMTNVAASKERLRTLLETCVDTAEILQGLCCLQNADCLSSLLICSDFIWDSGKLPFTAHLEKYILKNGKISTKIHEIGKTKTIFGLGMTPIYGVKNGQIKSLIWHTVQAVK